HGEPLAPFLPLQTFVVTAPRVYFVPPATPLHSPEVAATWVTDSPSTPFSPLCPGFPSLPFVPGDPGWPGAPGLELANFSACFLGVLWVSFVVRYLEAAKAPPVRAKQRARIERTKPAVPSLSCIASARSRTNSFMRRVLLV